jgi:phosphoenolpyruvate carboxykinase (GTP)
MQRTAEEILQSKLESGELKKLERIDNPGILEFVATYIDVCGPDRVFVCTDSAEDIAFVREEAVRSGEERKLKIAGHTIHFDNYYDQGRDKQNTKLLISREIEFGAGVNVMDREEGLKEIHELMKGIVRSGGTMYVLFFALGPKGSEFSIPCLQMTDSAYVAHSDHLLYRSGYEEFIRLGQDARLFKFVHSQGELEGAVSRNLEKRRIYIDLDGETVYSANTQYGGNTIGLKKLAFRLAIQRADREGWLAEHMFVMGAHGPRGRVTYFTGAFPSLCGKTSTSMIAGETIVGDDLAYLKIVDDEVRTVNVEKGVFGIIQGVNSVDDPIFWKTLHNPGEIIFSNVLVTDDGEVHWIGKDGDVPEKGENHSGEWHPGKKDREGNEIPVSHPNARFTLDLRLLENLDAELDNPEGVTLGGIIYGGRDSDTCVPVEESFDWAHGVVTKGASLESETTAATLGQEGVRKYNIMANLDFLSIPIGKYIQNHLDFGVRLNRPPKIFGVNYFLLDEKGNFLNEKVDKGVWLKWMELRVHEEVDAVKTPTGLIPIYEDLKALFERVLEKDYSKEDYIRQFTVRVPELLAKIDRIEHIYNHQVKDTPKVVLKILKDQRERLIKARKKLGDYISPENL